MRIASADLLGSSGSLTAWSVGHGALVLERPDEEQSARINNVLDEGATIVFEQESCG